MQRILIVLALATPCAAQSFNLDFHDAATPFGTPSPTYGAASGQTGTWNAISSVPIAGLRDVDGDLTPVEVALPDDIAFWNPDTGQSPTGPPAALIGDGVAPDPFTYDVVFTGLAPGSYDVYTYAASNQSIDVARITVDGVLKFLEARWNGAHTEGVDYVRHRADVDATGELRVTLSIIFGFMDFNGFQLVRVDEVGSLGCLGDGSGPACPCGNESSTAGRGCTHSGGYGMRIYGSGSTSIAADDLVLTADNCPPSNTGLFFVGMEIPTIQLFDGLMCSGGNAFRLQGQVQTNGVVTDTGFVAQDPFGSFFVPGTVYSFQYFTRDVHGAAPCGGHANLSPALRVLYTP